jgi:Fic family protein
MEYNWQQTDWLAFRHREQDFTEIALSFMSLAGQSQGYVQTLSNDAQAESVITLLVKEAIKTSLIEGELLSRADLISSIRRNLGYATLTQYVADKRSEGIATLLVKTRENFDSDLTEAQLLAWHEWLMLGNRRIQTRKYRTHNEPMQVISGAIGKETVHFEAPPSAQVTAEMQEFLAWFNRTKPDGASPIPNLLIRAAIAHLYFETIHPFEDGNGRIGRVIAEKALSQGLKRPILMSLSTAIEADKKAYYNAFKKAQRSNDANEWIHYFSQTIYQAQQDFIQTIDFVVKKTAFFNRHQAQLNAAQTRVLYRMLEVGDVPFQGGMNARKYQSIAQVSKATATRHLQDLVEKKILVTVNSGKNTRYEILLR